MKSFGWKWLGNLGSIAAIMATTTIGARAQSNLVLLMSAAGDRVGVGQTYYTTNPVDVILSGDATKVNVQAFGFTMILAGPSNSPLAPGVYSNAVQYPTDGDAPGLSVFGNGRSCTNVCGNFQILELATNTSGRVVKLWATFLQHCECDTTPPLTGEIRYDSQTATGGPLARILLVPQDFPSIQCALSAVSKMTVDTVLVSPGLYQESVQFGSNSAHVVSVAGPAATFITAPGATAVEFGVGYKWGTMDAMLTGFTITNSNAGVFVKGGYSPTIVSNEIVNCGSGLICKPTGSGVPASTVFQSNFVHGCTGWAVELWWTEAPRVEGNRVEGNGSGLLLWAAGTPEIRSNIIRSNAGDGLYMVNTYGVNIVQNLVIGNEGNGLNLFKPEGGMRGPWVYNNTILDNGLAGIATSIFADDADIHNNIVVGDPPLALGAGIFTHNDFYPATGAVLSGAVTNLIGVDGNISANPFLVCQPGQDFHLLPTSPCIDAGTTGVQIVMASDFDGHPRVQASTTDGMPILDMGAFEFGRENSVACAFVFCPTNIVAIAPPGQDWANVAYRPAYASPGAIINYSFPSGSAFVAGDNPVNVTVQSGSNLLSCGFTISVLVSNDFPFALNDTNRSWSVLGDAAWYVENVVTRDGIVAAQSGSITNNQTSTLQTVIEGPATLTFWWKVSSEANHDFLSVSVDDVDAGSISGETDWQIQTIYLGIGPQTVRWTYAKDASGSAGQDGAWVDVILVAPGGTPPILTSQPSSLAVRPGQNVTFSAGAYGTPPLVCQWTFDGANLSGATGSSLTVSNVQASDQGTYALVVTNPIGATNTAGARLELAQVVAWGVNSYGATQVPFGLSNIIAVAGGWHHSMALREDGRIFAWGANNAGQTNVPDTLTNAVAISSRSGDFGMALKPNGTVAVWGDNSFQQLNIPAGISNVVAIAAGGGHCFVLKADGTVASWGSINTVPVGLSNVVAIAAGDYANLVLKSDGTLAGWGQPTPPSGLSNVIAIAAGGIHSAALREDGTVVAWGDNIVGQTNVPAGLSNAVALVAGDYHTCALKADGTAVSWGKFFSGSYYIPAVPIAGLSNVVAIAAGSDHDVALLGNGPPVRQAFASEPRNTGQEFSLSVPTQSGRTYLLESRDAWDQTPWLPLVLDAGDGFSKRFTDTNALAPARYYRIRRW